MFLMLGLWLGVVNINNACQKKISIELMHVTWHPTKWWDWCMSEDKTKETEPFFQLIKITIELVKGNKN